MDALTELALNLRAAGHHGADDLWAELDPELRALPHNPWVILQTASRNTLR
jgi:starch phosphorylase